MIHETQEYFRLKDEAERMRVEAIRLLLLEQKEAMSQLKQLGYEGHGLPEVPELPKKQNRKTGKKSADSYCALCMMAGHDLRNHRRQKIKKAFTIKELVEYNLPGGRDTTEGIAGKHKTDRTIPWRAAKKLKQA